MLSVDEAGAAAGGITSATDPLASFAEMEMVYRRRFPTALSELADAGLDGHLAVLGQVYRLPRVGPELAQAIQSGGAALVKEVGAEGARELRRQVRSEMEEFLRVAGRAGVPTDNLTAAVELLGLKRIAATGDVSRAATSAVRDLIGRRFHVAGTWYTPREIAGEPTDPARIEAWLEAAKTEKVIRALAPGKRGAEREGLIRAAVDTGVWVTNRDGTGAVLMVPGTGGRMAPLMDARRMRLEVDFVEASRPTLEEVGRGQRSETVPLKEVLTAIKERKERQPGSDDGLTGGGEDTLMGAAKDEEPRRTDHATPDSAGNDPFGTVQSGTEAVEQKDAQSRTMDSSDSGSQTEDENEERGEAAEPHKEFLDSVERTYREYVRAGREKGLDLAADMLKHYLDGSGNNVTVPLERAHGFKPIRDAERFNQKRIEKAFVDQAHPYWKQITEMKDGDSIVLQKDHWERKLHPMGLLARGEIDLALAAGTSHVLSEGVYRATRKGDMITITGVVTHTWADRYDFHKWQPFAEGALALEQHRGAKPFDVEARWEQIVGGTLRRRRGQWTVRPFDWVDREPERS